MSEEIIKVLDNLGQKFGIAVDWTSSNIIPYLQDLMQRFITYRNAVAICQIFLAIVGLVFAIICIKKLKKWAKSEDYKKDYSNEELFMWGNSRVPNCIINSSILYYRKQSWNFTKYIHA